MFFRKKDAIIKPIQTYKLITTFITKSGTRESFTIPNISESIIDDVFKELCKSLHNAIENSIYCKIDLNCGIHGSDITYFLIEKEQED